MTPSSATLERPPAPVDVVRRRGRLATFRGWLLSDVTIMFRTVNVMVSGRGQ